MNDNYTVKLSVAASFEYEVAYKGNPLKSKDTDNNNYGIMNAKDCQLLCRDTLRCGWFNVNKKGNCYLKTSKGTKKINDVGGVSGPRYSGEGINRMTSTL